MGDGEIVALLGPNGAGKTTLLRILSTLTRPDKGEVLLDGLDIYEEPVDARKKLGVVGHSNYLYDDLSPIENLRFYWSMNSLPKEGFESTAEGVLGRLGIMHRMNDRVSVLSKGMRQRLAIARALIHSPKVLLLDEPYSSLDQKGVEILTAMLSEQRAKGVSVVIVTHDASRIAELADRVDVLLEGKICKTFARQDLAKNDFEQEYRASIEGAGA